MSALSAPNCWPIRGNFTVRGDRHITACDLHRWHGRADSVRLRRCVSAWDSVSVRLRWAAGSRDRSYPGSHGRCKPAGKPAAPLLQSSSLPRTVPGEIEAGSAVLALVKSRPGRLAAQAAVLGVVIGASVLYATLDKTVTLSVDGKTSEVHAFSKTVGALLDHEGIKVGPKDIVAPGQSSSLGEGETVVVRYARPLTVTVDGEKRTYWTTELSVDRALNALGIRAEGAQLSASRSQRIDRAGLAMW